MIDLFTFYEGKWAVVGSIDGKFIGRIVEEKENGAVLLQPVFDYMSRLIQQGNGLGRDALVLPHDLCSSMESKLEIVSPSTILYFDNMEEVDREQYEKITKKGAEIARQSKAIKSNIIIADRMPPTPGQKIQL